MSVDEIQCPLLVEQFRERRGRNFLETKYLTLLGRLEMIVGGKKKILAELERTLQSKSELLTVLWKIWRRVKVNCTLHGQESKIALHTIGVPRS